MAESATLVSDVDNSSAYLAKYWVLNAVRGNKIPVWRIEALWKYDDLCARFGRSENMATGRQEVCCFVWSN